MTPETITLPIDLRNGNTGRTKHFGASAKRRKEYEHLIKSFGLVRTPPAHRQAITITRILGKRQRLMDPDSLGRGNAKEIIDALTACGFWQDDSAKHIERVDYRQDDTRRDEGPAVEICIEAAA